MPGTPPSKNDAAVSSATSPRPSKVGFFLLELLSSFVVNWIGPCQAGRAQLGPALHPLGGAFFRATRGPAGLLAATRFRALLGLTHLFRLGVEPL